MLTQLKKEWQAWKNKIYCFFHRDYLTEYDALQLYDILMKYDSTMPKRFEQYMKSTAEMYMGMYACAAAWHGVVISPEAAKQILKKYSHRRLSRLNVATDGSHFGCQGMGMLVELGVLCFALPHEMVMKHFSFNMEERAKEQGVTLQDVRETLEQYVVSLDETKKRINFSKNMDTDVTWNVIASVLGTSMLGDDGQYYYVEGKLPYDNYQALLNKNNVFVDKFDFLSGT
jgi:hypothetical protein